METTTQTKVDDAQIEQTIEMFEVITQSQPLDYQSLEILKEAYSQVGREEEVVRTSKKIAAAHVQLGQISSAILEYETLLHSCPDDVEVQKALEGLESQADGIAEGIEGVDPSQGDHTTIFRRHTDLNKPSAVDDGRKSMFKLFVGAKTLAEADFDNCWRTQDLSTVPTDVIDPFIQILADKGLLPLEQSLRILSDKTRMAFMPLERYDIDIDLTRSFPAEVCRRWCVLPFDRLSKSVMVATANPFSQQAAKEVAAHTNNRLVWCLASPVEIISLIRKAFR